MILKICACFFIVIIAEIYGDSSATEEVPESEDVRGSLIEAVIERNDTLVHRLIDHGVFIDVRDNEGKTPLIHASSISNNSKTVRYLVEAGADPNLFDSNGATALHAAVQVGDCDSVKFLFPRVRNHEVRDKVGRSAFYLAIANNHSDVSSYLLSAGADPYSRDSMGLTPIHLAAKLGYTNILSAMLSNDSLSIDVELNHDTTTPLLLSAMNDHPDTAEFLIKNGADVDSHNNSFWTPLHSASYFDRLELVKLLVENNATIDKANNEGRTPLYVASDNGHLDIVEFLINQGADKSVKDNYGNSLIHAGVHSGNLELIKFLVGKKCVFDDKNFRNDTPLTMATKFGNLEVVKYLVDLGANLNETDFNDDSVMHIAAMRGDTEMLKYFCGKNVTVDSKNILDMVPLHFAAVSGNDLALKLIVEKIADKRHDNFSAECYANIVNIEDRFNRTPTFLAAENGHLGVLKTLLEFGGDYNITNRNGTSPFQVAASKGKIDILNYLFDNHDIDINYEDFNHNTALFLAAEEGELSALKCLLDNGADPAIGRSYNLIHAAAANGHSDVIEALKDYSNMTDSPDDSLRTPAWYAAFNGRLNTLKVLSNLNANLTHDVAEAAVLGSQPEVLKYLLMKDINVNSKNDDGQTLLGFAIGNKLPNMVKVLIELGADINSMDRGQTYLELALSLKRQDIANILLDSGEDINQLNTSGFNPLHRAVIDKKLDNIIYLLRKGANISAKSADGRTALDLSPDEEIKDFLLEYLKPQEES